MSSLKSITDARKNFDYLNTEFHAKDVLKVTQPKNAIWTENGMCLMIDGDVACKENDLWVFFW